MTFMRDIDFLESDASIRALGRNLADGLVQGLRNLASNLQTRESAGITLHVARRKRLDYL